MGGNVTSAQSAHSGQDPELEPTQLSKMLCKCEQPPRLSNILTDNAVAALQYLSSLCAIALATSPVGATAGHSIPPLIVFTVPPKSELVMMAS